MTPGQHPLVARVPEVSKLVLAVGGSYHCAKFLPKIGEMVCLLLDGHTDTDTVEGRLLRRWGWTREPGEIGVHSALVPKTFKIAT